jgi:hypothetical protein
MKTSGRIHGFMSLIAPSARGGSWSAYRARAELSSDVDKRRLNEVVSNEGCNHGERSKEQGTDNQVIGCDKKCSDLRARFPDNIARKTISEKMIISPARIDPQRAAVWLGPKSRKAAAITISVPGGRVSN